MKVVGYAWVYWVPLVLMFVAIFFEYRFITEMQPGLIRAIVNAFVGILVSGCIYLFLQKSYAKMAMSPVLMGGIVSLLWGLLIGLFISFASGIGFAVVSGYGLSFGKIFTNLHINSVANLSPALLEEFVFRGGMVELTTNLLGRAAGLGIGSVPFGILHLLGKLFGNPVTLAQVLGISLAGLMLSLVYIHFGISGAFACHWVWNSLVANWVRVYETSDKVTVNAIEASWVTCAVLLAVSLVLFLNLPAKSA